MIDPAELRHGDVAGRVDGKSEPVLTDSHAGVNPNLPADKTVTQGGAGADLAVFTDDDALSIDRIGPDPAAISDFRIGLDHHARDRSPPRARPWRHGSIRALAAIPRRDRPACGYRAWAIRA